MADETFEDFKAEYTERLSLLGYNATDVYTTAKELGLLPDKVADGLIELYLRQSKSMLMNFLLVTSSQYRTKRYLYNVLGVVIVDDIGVREFTEFCKRLIYLKGTNVYTG